MLTSELVVLRDAELVMMHNVLTPELADLWLTRLRQQIAWRQDLLSIGGRQSPIPRMQAWYGDAGASYSYSGLKMQPLPWTPFLGAIRQKVEALSGESFNAVLLNWYRDGSDSVGWHSDDEPELGVNPVIASLSLGATRLFRMQHKSKKQWAYKLELEQGSLLVMRGVTQHYWRHQLPKTRRAVGQRINLTFRWVKSP